MGLILSGLKFNWMLKNEDHTGSTVFILFDHWSWKIIPRICKRPFKQMFKGRKS